MSRRRTGAIAVALALGGFLVVSVVAPSSLRKCSALAPLGFTLMNACSDFFGIIDMRSANQKISDYTNAIEINPNDADSYWERGIAKEDLGDLKGAIFDYTKVLEIDPQDSHAYYIRGIAKNELGDYEGAIADYNKVIEIRPDADAYAKRALVKKQQKDYQGAIADFENAKMYCLTDCNPKIYYYLGITKEESGDQQGACNDYKKAASLGSQSTAQWLNSADGAWCRNMR